jgi:ketosteroid isomerase-like protein
VNKAEGEVTSKHRTRGAAAEAGRRQAQHLESDHVIHGRDGRIREKNSYGDDPHPPKDQR